MRQSALIASGSGYADDRSFDGYEVIRHPLPEREQRILGVKDGKPGTGVCYRAYDIKLAIRKPDAEGLGRIDRESTVYILMHHGGGRRVIRLGGVYDNGEMIEGLKSLPDVALYGLLHSIYSAVTDSIGVAIEETTREWQLAARDKRIKVHRPKQGRQRIEILPPPDPLAP